MVVCGIILAWYIAAIFMNTVVAEPKIEALGGGFANTVNVSWSLDRPVMPAPHQVVVEVWKTVFLVCAVEGEVTGLSCLGDAVLDAARLCPGNLVGHRAWP